MITPYAIRLLIILLMVIIIYQDVKRRKKKRKACGYISQIKIGEQPKPGNNFYYTNKFKGQFIMLQLTDSQQAVGTLAFVDKKGQSTDVADGAVSVQSSDEAIATASYDDAKNEVTVVAVAPGVAALQIKATSQSGEDIPFEDTAIEVKSGNAVGGTVTFGEPSEQP